MKAWLVDHPTGTGKTRTVLRRILRGAGSSGAEWRRRMRGTLIIGPKNGVVRKVWCRELALLARKRGLISASKFSETDLHKMSYPKLEQELEAVGLVIPLCSTYMRQGKHRLVSRAMRADRRRCMYLVLDEWHRMSSRMRGYCQHWLKTGARRAWYVGGYGSDAVQREIFFVSATPVNPVLEKEIDDLTEVLESDELHEDRVRQAIKRAALAVNGFCGRITSQEEFDEILREERFHHVIRKLGIVRMGLSPDISRRWHVPLPVIYRKKDRFSEFELGQLRELSDSEEDPELQMRYRAAVGLIGTASRKHWLDRGSRSCFGRRYKAKLYHPKVQRKLGARTWIAQHPRVESLISLLEGNGILEQGGLRLTGQKCLIFCHHAGVAKGLALTLQARLRSRSKEDSHFSPVECSISRSLVRRGRGGRPGRRIRAATRTRKLTHDFNDAKRNPLILIVTDDMSESIDLHKACETVIHYELPWSPIRLFQRVGRLTRLRESGKFPKILVGHVILPGNVEEERVNRLCRRMDYLRQQELANTPGKPGLVQLLEGYLGRGPSLHLNEVLGAASAHRSAIDRV